MFTNQIPKYKSLGGVCKEKDADCPSPAHKEPIENRIHKYTVRANIGVALTHVDIIVFSARWEEYLLVVIINM